MRWCPRSGNQCSVVVRCCWNLLAAVAVTAGGSNEGGSNEPPVVGRFCPVVGHLNATKSCAISGVLGIEVRDGCQYFGYTRGGVFGWLFDTGVVSEVVSSSARGQSELGIWSELRGLQPRL